MQKGYDLAEQASPVPDAKSIRSSFNVTQRKTEPETDEEFRQLPSTVAEALQTCWVIRNLTAYYEKQLTQSVSGIRSGNHSVPSACRPAEIPEWFNSEPEGPL